jgi:hypothetical protein
MHHGLHERRLRLLRDDGRHARRVQHVLNRLLSEAPLRVESNFATNVLAIHADRQQLPEGGRLAPRVRTGKLPGAIPAIMIEVADTGGTPADLLARVFDPFFTIEEEGRGTGWPSASESSSSATAS